MAKKLIVSIDGGGIRGVIPLLILKQIQTQLSFDFNQLNPIWWGTSTGALIASSLEIQKGEHFETAVQNVLDLYEFRSTGAIQPKGTSLPTRALDQMINTNFSGIQLKNLPNLNIVVSKLENKNTVVFNEKKSCDLALAVKASCAFPGIFPPVNIGGEYFVDGFYNAKNPAQLSVSDIDFDENEVIVLSLGTGILRQLDEVEDQVNKVDLAMGKMADEGKVTYHRLNPKLTLAADGMQNTNSKNIFNLRKDTLSYLSQNAYKIKEMVLELEAFKLP